MNPEDAPAAMLARFAKTAARDLPLYRHLSERATQDAEVAERLLVARPGQRVPVLLFAAVHDVLLSADSSAPDPMSAWYASITTPPRAVGPGADDPWPHFRRLVLDDRGVEERLRTRTTQTNEVGRCAAWLPALTMLTRGSPTGDARRLGLVEIGASAGLNLLVDRHGYRYRSPGGPDVRLNATAPVQLETTWRGDLRPDLSGAPPMIASRLGLDLHPVDLTDTEQVRWLIACQWPDQPDRVARARAALAAARPDPPSVRAADAVDGLAPAVAEVPEDALAVVLSSWVLSYLGTERRRAFVVQLERCAQQRDLTLLYQEQPYLVDGLPGTTRRGGRGDGPEGPTALVRVDWRDGHAGDPVRLAEVHPHGLWIEWLAES